MANVHTTFTGDAGGLVAAAATAQGAIDSLHGKTVEGLAGGLGGAAREADRLGSNLGRAGDKVAGVSRATRGMSGDFERAGRTARGMSDDLGRAGDHLNRFTEQAGRAQTAVAQLGSGSGGMRAIESGAVGAGRGMRELEAGTVRAHAAITSAGSGLKELESGASRAALAVRNIAPSGGGSLGGGIRDSIIDMHKLSDGTYGVAEGMRAIESGAARATRSAEGLGKATKAAQEGAGGGGSAKPFSWGGQSFSYSQGTPRPEGTYSQAHAKEQEKAASGAGATSWARPAAADLDEVGNASERTAEKMSGALLPSMGKLSNMGWTGAAALGAAVGVMTSATDQSVAMGKATAGLGMNLDGMNNMLTRTEQTTARGLMGGMLGNQDAQLRQSARTMTQELGPAIRSSVAAVGAMETAKMGAWGALGPQMKSFADTVKTNAPGLQSMMTSLGGAALNLGSDTVAGLAQSAPAWASLASTVSANGPQITSAVTQVSRGFAEAAQFTASTVGSAQSAGDAINDTLDSASGAKRDSSGQLSSVGGDQSWAGKIADWAGATLGGGKISSLSAMPRGTDAWGHNTGAAGSAKAPASGAFDPNQPFSGTLPDGTVGTGDGGAVKPTKAGGYHRSPDAAWADGMTGAQVLTAERGAIGLGPVGSPEYGGLGAPPAGLGQPLPGAAPPASQRGGAPLPPRVGGPGSAGGGAAIPPAIAGGLGVGSIAPLNNMLAAAAPQVPSGGGAAGAAMVQHVQKAVQTAAPAAEAGGASLGGAMTGGMASAIGSTSTQTVTDTVMIKHIKKTLDTAAGPSGIDAHSPSKKYHNLFRAVPQGQASGIRADAPQVFDAMNETFGQMGSMGSRFSSDYAGADSPTISVSKNQAAPGQDPAQDPSNPLLSTSSTSMVPPVNHFGAAGMANVQAHNDRAAQLAQGRADLHAKAMANLGVTNPSTGQRWQDPTANRNPFAGTPRDPFGPGGANYRAPNLTVSQKAGNMWSSLNTHGPQDGLAGIKDMFHTGGQNAGQGLAQGLQVHMPAVAAAGAGLAGAAQDGHKKKDKAHSPAQAWADMAGNSVAGAVGGLNAGLPALAAAGAGMADAVQGAAIGPMSTAGLQVGFTYSENVVTGAQTALKTALLQSASVPTGLGEQATTALGNLGLLGPGSGASVYKDPSATFDTTGLVGAMTTAFTAALANLNLSVQNNVSLDGDPFYQYVNSAVSGLVGEMYDAAKGR